MDRMGPWQCASRLSMTYRNGQANESLLLDRACEIAGDRGCRRQFAQAMLRRNFPGGGRANEDWIQLFGYPRRR
jgi:hypothetical protein